MQLTAAVHADEQACRHRYRPPVTARAPSDRCVINQLPTNEELMRRYSRGRTALFDMVRVQELKHRVTCQRDLLHS